MSEWETDLGVWADRYIKELNSGVRVSFRPKGHSMTPHQQAVVCFVPAVCLAPKSIQLAEMSLLVPVCLCRSRRAALRGHRMA